MVLSFIFVVDVKIIFCNNFEAHLINVGNSQFPGDLIIFTKEMFNVKLTLCEKGSYSKFSGPYFPAFELSTERYSVSLRI